MSLLKVLLLCALVGYVTAATRVRPCRNGSPAPSEVVFSGCTNDDGLPCYLRDGAEYDISVTFTPNSYVGRLKSELKGKKGWMTENLDTSKYPVCDNIYTSTGSKSWCPLSAGETYVFQLHFLAEFPWRARLVNKVDYIRFALKEGNRDVVCFEIDNVNLIQKT